MIVFKELRLALDLLDHLCDENFGGEGCALLASGMCPFEKSNRPCGKGRRSQWRDKLGELIQAGLETAEDLYQRNLAHQETEEDGNECD